MRQIHGTGRWLLHIDLNLMVNVGKWMFPKNRVTGWAPKMDGENNGSNPMNKWMMWGSQTPYFWVDTQIYQSHGASHWTISLWTLVWVAPKWKFMNFIPNKSTKQPGAQPLTVHWKQGCGIHMNMKSWSSMDGHSLSLGRWEHWRRVGMGMVFEQILRKSTPVTSEILRHNGFFPW